MPARNVAIRLGVEGGAEVKRALDDAGASGQAAFQKLGAAADQAGAATDRLTQKVRGAGDAAKSVSASPASPTPPVPAPSAALQREVERVRRQVDDEYRKAQQFGRADQAIVSGSRAGYFDATEADRLRRLAAAKYDQSNDNDPARRGLASFQKRDLAYQASDVVASLGSGAGLGTVAFQQGGQILQGLSAGEGGLKGGLVALGQSAAALVTPFTVAATAATALGGAFLYAGKAASDDRSILQKATQGLGRGTGATVAQLDQLAKANAEAGKVSVSTAREIAAGYASTGQIAVPVIDDLIRTTSEFARITGADIPSATATLAAAFADPARGADTLAQSLGGLDDKTRELIRTQIEQGDRSAAQQTLADSLKASIDANAVSTTGWAAAWNTAAAAANGYWEAAKRIAGIKLGVAPEGAADAVKRLQAEVDAFQKQRVQIGAEPLTAWESKKIRDLEAAKVIADTEAREARGRAAEEAASKASITAGEVARSVDPLGAQYRDLVAKRNQLQATLDDGLSRSKLADVGEVERARDAYTRAADTMVDANGKLVTSADRARQADQLRLDALKATTAAEKAAIAERQKAFDLAGKVMSGLDAGASISRAGILAQAEAQAKASKGGRGRSSDTDDYTRAIRSTEDRIRRQDEEATTFGMAAEEVARYRTETELLTAAKRAERDITPELTAQIKSYADQAAAAAQRQEELRESARQADAYRSAGSDGVRSLVRDLQAGTSAGSALENMLGRIRSRIGDIAAESIADGIFGKRGSSGGIVDSLLAGAKSALGFAKGGFTGDIPATAVAGWVHGKEYVFDAGSTARLGVPFLESLRQGARGYRRGGYVDDGTVGFPSGMGGEAAIFVGDR